MAMTSVNIRLPSEPPNLKLQLANSAQVNISDISTLLKQIIKGSKTSENLSQVHRSFVASESNIENTFFVFQKISTISTQLGYQHKVIDKHIRHTSVVLKQLDEIKKEIIQ